jgi:hypothetical protein
LPQTALNALTNFRSGSILVAIVALAVATCMIPPARAAGVTVTVTTTANTVDGNTSSVTALIASPGADGKISFPEAVAAVNNTGPGNTIKFAVAPGSTVHTDALSTYLTASFTTIDGDMNGDGAPDVLLTNSQNSFMPLVITSDHNTLEHVAMPNGPGLVGAGANSNTLSGLYLGTDVLGKLRRGHWSLQAELDLHGLTSDEARDALADFLYEARQRGFRCVRVVHGKGLTSPNREPVLKGKVRKWLAHLDDVLAYSEAPRHAGGGGAVLILLKGGR